MTAADQWTLGRRPSLDGLRAVAVLLVLVCHTVLTPVQTAGPIGVTVFFTLSGFLITALLLGERARTGRISLLEFYRRRAVRLLPALLLYLGSMAVFARLSAAGTSPSRADFLGSLFYVSNYTTAMRGRDNVLVHTWSLAVEEQFYIVWPLLLIAVLAAGCGRRGVLVIAGAGSVLAIALRLLLWDGGAGHARIYYGTDTHMDGLLVGCIAAAWMHGRRPGRNRPAVALACLTAVVLLSPWSGAVKYLVVPTVVPLLVAVAILALVQQTTGRTLTGRPLRWIGRRSYAIYLWHFPLFGAAASLPSPARWPALAVAVVLTAAIAEMSWRCVEEPLLRFRTPVGEAAQPTPGERPPTGKDAPGQVLV